MQRLAFTLTITLVCIGKCTTRNLVCQKGVQIWQDYMMGLNICSIVLTRLSIQYKHMTNGLCSLWIQVGIQYFVKSEEMPISFDQENKSWRMPIQQISIFCGKASLMALNLNGQVDVAEQTFFFLASMLSSRSLAIARSTNSLMEFLPGTRGLSASSSVASLRLDFPPLGHKA